MSCDDDNEGRNESGETAIHEQAKGIAKRPAQQQDSKKWRQDQRDLERQRQPQRERVTTATIRPV